MSMVDMFKQISKNQNSSEDPVNLIVGSVTSADPLEIYVHDKLTLKKDFLILAEHLTNHRRTITFKNTTNITLSSSSVAGQTTVGGTDSHSHGFESITMNGVQGSFAIENAVIEFQDELKKGDSVMLCRLQGGQQYYVADRVVNP